MITAIEITRHRTRSTADAVNIATLSRQPDRGRFYFVKVRLDDGRRHVHVGYAEELPDCVRIYDQRWIHVGTAPTITDALAVVAARADVLAPATEPEAAQPMPVIVTTGSRRR